MLHNIDQTAAEERGGQHWQAMRHCLQRHQTERLRALATRDAKDVGRLVSRKARRIFQTAFKKHAISHVQTLNQRL